VTTPLYRRHLLPRIREALRDTPIVLVNGPRQAGKTTLARQFAEPARTYVTLDDAVTLAVVRHDPTGFVRELDAAVIDEVQRVAELLLAIKQQVDQDRRPGHFLLTGSANVMTLPRVADSLARRRPKWGLPWSIGYCGVVIRKLWRGRHTAGAKLG
jgi:uncharacterized protein